MTSPKTPGAPSARSGAVIWIGVGVVIVILGIAAVLVARGGSDDDVVGSPAGATREGDLPRYDAKAEEDPAIGMTIPTVTGKDFDGNDVTISGEDGTAKVMLFVAHWCPHCQREVPLLKEHLDEVPMPEDVELVTVSTSEEPGAENYPPQEWLEREGWSAPVVVDGDTSIAEAYGLSAFPYFVVVDADGKVVARASGELLHRRVRRGGCCGPGRLTVRPLGRIGSRRCAPLDQLEAAGSREVSRVMACRSGPASCR
ncbi:TlpA family protein disulfide reductase [Aquihabitans daechungensis]|uniref:TlpA family protein disulfide reductase n=1 Tax=Aquihabitans daechungensis TaxID=1052257 RepID=UPI003B9EF663